MSNEVVNANQSSNILRSLADVGTVDLSYKMDASYPILSKRYFEILSQNSISGAPAGQEVSFNLPKMGLLRDLVLKTAYTTATTGMAATQYVGLQMFEYIQIRSGSKVLFNLSDTYIQARTMCSPVSKAEAIYRRALPLVPTTEVVATTGSASCVTYTPVFNSFCDSVENALNLSFYEQVQVAAKFNTSARAGFNYDLTGASCTLWVWNYVLDQKADDALRSKNQNISRPLQMLTTNSFMEQIACTSTTQNQIRLNVNYPVFNTFVCVRGNTTALLGAYFKIDSFEFSIAGNKILENVPGLVGSWENSSRGNCSNVGVASATTFSRIEDSGIVCINWGLDVLDRTYNSGAVSFSGLNYPQVLVNHQSLGTAASYNLIVCSEYLQILSLDGKTGILSVVANT